jgi:CTP synthase (UTP-ammonia lyase)
VRDQAVALGWAELRRHRAGPLRERRGLVRIVVLGDRDPRFLTHRELDAALALFPEGARAGWTRTDERAARRLDDAWGVWLVPGSPYRDDAAAYAAIRHCLATGTPFLGTCASFQYACVELARSRAGLHSASHAESDPEGDALVVQPLSCTLYGERRLVKPVPGTRLARICGEEPFDGFHWCGYGLAERYVPLLTLHGVTVGARSVDAGVEAIELGDHPFFVATAFQPQIGASETGSLHPLIRAFLEAALEADRRRHVALSSRLIPLSSKSQA